MIKVTLDSFIYFKATTIRAFFPQLAIYFDFIFSMQMGCKCNTMTRVLRRSHGGQNESLRKTVIARRRVAAPDQEMKGSRRRWLSPPCCIMLAFADVSVAAHLSPEISVGGKKIKMDRCVQAAGGGSARPPLMCRYFTC